MSVEIEIDRAIYSVDDTTRAYRFLRSNPDWKKLDAIENESNKRRIDGYTRGFRDGTTRVFRLKR